MELSSFMKGFSHYYNVFIPYYSKDGRTKYLYSISTIATFSLVLGSIINDLSLPGFNRDFYFETSYAIIETAGILIIVLALLRNQSDLSKILQLLEEPFYVFGPSVSHNKVITDYAKVVRFLAPLYLISFILLTFFKVSLPLIFIFLNYQDLEVNELPLPISRLPFTTDSYLIFWAFFLLATFYFIVLSLTFISWALAFMYSILRIKTQINILNASLLGLNERAEQRCKTLLEFSDAAGLCSGSSEDALQQCTVECLDESIRVHQQIISQVNLVQRTFSMTALMYTQAMALHVAFQGIQFSTVSASSSALVSAIMPLFISLCHLFLLNYCGERISDESENLHFALYSCPWVGKTKLFKTKLRIMMRVASRPLRLTACRLYSLNMRTTYNVLKAAYSLFNMLVSVQKKHV